MSPNEIKGHSLIWQRMPRKANENEKSRHLFIMKRDLESILQPTAGCFTDSWIYYGKRRAKTPSERTKNKENFCKYAFSAERRRRIKRCIEHAIPWLSVLTCVQMPRLRKSCYCCSLWQSYWPCIPWFGSSRSMVPLSLLWRLCIQVLRLEWWTWFGWNQLL